MTKDETEYIINDMILENIKPIEKSIKWDEVKQVKGVKR